MRIDIDHIDTLIKGADPADTSCLVDADSPEAEQIWERVLAATSSGTAAPFSRPGPGRSRGVVWPTISVGTVAVVVILVLQFLPTPALQAPSAAAAALRRLADQAAVAEPAPILKDDQWLQSEYQVSYLAAPPHIAPESSAVESARAVVTVNAEDWANNLSQSCSQQVVTSVAYKNPASQRAWSSGGIGLPSTASPQCVSGMLGKVSQSAGTLDVAKLPTDPSALAQALRTGTTGLAVLDHPFIGGRELTPFGRAVTLLASPTLGATPALWSALLRAMATMPGVALLGTTTAHNGAVGVALAGATGEGYRTTIILSPSTGALLEARNLMVDQLVAGLGGSIGVVTIQWLDPSGIPPRGGCRHAPVIAGRRGAYGNRVGGGGSGRHTASGERVAELHPSRATSTHLRELRNHRQSECERHLGDHAHSRS